jgi:pseudouridine synthase
MSESVALGRLLAARGVASRRKAEDLIFKGLVTVDGVVIRHPAHIVVPDEVEVHVDGKALPDAPPPQYYLVYKPKGCITGRDDPQGRKSIFDVVENLPHRVEPVGRLDFDTEGALLLTNDGPLAHALTHPSRKVPKRYRVKMWKTPSEKMLTKIRKGQIFLEDGQVPPCKVRVVEQTDTQNAWVEITVTEGRNRLIRRLFSQIGHPVSKLRRESFATISIRDMVRGQVRPLTSEEIRRLRDLAEGRKPVSAGKLVYKKGYAKPKARKVRPNQSRRKQGGPRRAAPDAGSGRKA